MNLIVDGRQLDRQQERAIYELTLKKQRSKKSTVSHKQVVAMQQLANELLAQRKNSPELLDLNHNLKQNYKSGRAADSQRTDTRNHVSERYPSFKTTMCRCHSASALAEPELKSTRFSDRSDKTRQLNHEEALNVEPTEAEEISSNDRTLTESNVGSPQRAAQGVAIANGQHQHQPHYKSSKELQRQSSTSTIATTSTSTSSVSSASSASHSLSSASSMASRPHACQIVSNSSFISTSNSSTSMSDEANTKLIHLRLEQLNNELERRLHQYEYLVAQEKSILGTYNLNLFRNESVNNFHLFARANDQKNPL